MITEKLYESDGLCAAFHARVLSAVPARLGYAVLLDRTAFFPEGGGQSADTGTIGTAKVLDVQIADGEILHYTDRLPDGEEVDCALDFDERFRKMQNHLGEHLLCGAIHKLYGCENVGFHLGADYMTFDIDGVLDSAQIQRAELLANRAVAEDAPVHCTVYPKEALASLSYRAKSEKLAAADAIRIVEVEGFDRCACCAPHLDRAGKIGVIKIVDAMHYKGGMRFSALCGFDALADYTHRQNQVHSLSMLLSAKPDEIVDAAKKRLDEATELRHELGALRRAYAERLLQTIPKTEGNFCLFDSRLDANALRSLADSAACRCGGLFAVFSGSDEAGYQFAISAAFSLAEKTPAIRAALGGKCGGSDRMLFGRTDQTEREIRKIFE